MATDASDREEQQQYELEEIRRSFTEIGIRVGSLFEPAEHDSDELVLPVPVPVTRARPPSLVLALVVVCCLLIGGGIGYLLHHPTPPTAGAVRRESPSVVTQATPPAPASQPRVVASPSCLQTAQRADALIDLFVRNVRDRRLSLALKAYTLASQACRKETSP